MPPVVEEMPARTAAKTSGALVMLMKKRTTLERITRPPAWIYNGRRSDLLIIDGQLTMVD